MSEKVPLYQMASELIKHLKNKNYGLAEALAMELWGRLAEEHHNEEHKQE